MNALNTWKDKLEAASFLPSKYLDRQCDMVRSSFQNNFNVKWADTDTIVIKGDGARPPSEERFMIAPLLFLIIPGRIIFVIIVIEQILTLIIFRIFSSESS